MKLFGEIYGTVSYTHLDVYKRQGTTGNIYDGIIPTVDATIAGEFGRIMAWADKYRTMKEMCIRDRSSSAAQAVLPLPQLLTAAEPS